MFNLNLKLNGIISSAIQKDLKLNEELKNNEKFEDYIKHFSLIEEDQQSTNDLISKSREYIKYAKQNLYDFLLHDKEKSNVKSQNDVCKKKSEIKNVKTSESQLTKNAQNNLINSLNLKTLVSDKNKRKLLKLLFKLKEEEKIENNDLNFIQIRKDCQLLSRYIKEEKLSYLILKLFPQNKGYSISLKKILDKNGTKNNLNNSKLKTIETIKLPYEQKLFLEYIDNEQMPPMLLDVLDSNCDFDEHLDLFHYGKLFIEIQDYRRCANINNLTYESRFVLLKPTNQTVINDIERITCLNPNSKKVWSNEDKLELESKLILSTTDPLCLDPDPLVFLSNSQINYEKKWLKTDKVQKVCRKGSQVYLNQIEKFHSLPAPKSLELFDFLKKKHNQRQEHVAQEKLNKNINEFMFEKEKILLPPKAVSEDVKRCSKVIELPVRNDNSLTKLEEYKMEYSEIERISTVAIITIFYRQIDDTYFGQLNVEKNSKLLSNSNQFNQSNQTGSCLFQLGNKILTKKYIEQFIEILSEHGRKSVKITTTKPGEASRINFTKKVLNINTNNSPNNLNNVCIDNYNIPNKKIKLTSSPNHMNDLITNGNINTLNVSSNNISLEQNSYLIPKEIINNQFSNHPIQSSSNTNIINKSSINSPNVIINNCNSINTIGTHNNNQLLQSHNLGEVHSFTISNNLNNNSSHLVTNLHQNNACSNSGKIQYQSSPIHQLTANSNQVHQQQNSHSNNLIANNPILNNLITNSSGPSHLIQNNIQLNTQINKNVNNLTNGTNGTLSSNQITSNQVNSTVNIMNHNILDNNILPISISSPLTSVSRLNNKSGKPETVAVILTTNTLPSSGFISNKTENSSEPVSSSPIIQISNSGQTASTNSLPTGVNLSSLGITRGQNLRLHNLISLANVQGTNQCIALPISLMMTPNSNGQQQTITGLTAGTTNAAIMTNTGNMIVGIDTKNNNTHQQNVVVIDHTNTPDILEHQHQLNQNQPHSRIATVLHPQSANNQSHDSNTFNAQNAIIMSNNNQDNASGIVTQSSVLSVPIGVTGSLGLHNLAAHQTNQQASTALLPSNSITNPSTSNGTSLNQQFTSSNYTQHHIMHPHLSNNQESSIAIHLAANSSSDTNTSTAIHIAPQQVQLTLQKHN